MVQKTLSREEVARDYVIMGIPVSEAPGARKRSDSMGLSHQGERNVLYSLEGGPYFSFHITKQIARDVLNGARPTVPVAFDIRGPQSNRWSYIVTPRTREDVLEALTLQVPKQLYLKSQEKVRRNDDTGDVREDDVLHRLWMEGNSLFQFYDAGVVLEAKYNKKNIWYPDFPNARFRAHGGYWSTGGLLQGEDFDSIIKRAEQEARQEEKLRKTKH